MIQVDYNFKEPTCNDLSFPNQRSHRLAAFHWPRIQALENPCELFAEKRHSKLGHCRWEALNLNANSLKWLCSQWDLNSQHWCLLSIALPHEPTPYHIVDLVKLSCSLEGSTFRFWAGSILQFWSTDLMEHNHLWTDYYMAKLIQYLNDLQSYKDSKCLRLFTGPTTLWVTVSTLLGISWTRDRKE